MNKRDEKKDRRDDRKRERREWKLIKPRPLNDLVKNSSGLIKWLLLAGGLLYLFLNGSGMLTLLNK